MDSPEVSVEIDEIVFVLSPPEEGWVFVENIGGEEGYIPISCIQPILPSQLVIREEQDDVESPVQSAKSAPSQSAQGDLTGSDCVLLLTG